MADHSLADQLDWQRLLLLATAYFCAFVPLLLLAGLWTADDFYSLWFPAAGLRFAVLWQFGPRLAPLLAIVETVAIAIVGFASGAPIDLLPLLGGGLSVPLTYGAAIAFAGHTDVRSFSLNPVALRFGLAACLSSAAAFLVNVFWRGAAGDHELLASGLELVPHLITFLTGDVLGILLLAPPLLWAWRLVSARRRLQLGSWRKWASATVIIGLAALVTAALGAAGFGVRLLPLMLGVVALGIANGRIAAVAATLAIGAAVLASTALGTRDGADAILHLELIAIMILAFVGGSYADDRRRMRKEIRIRDSALLHSERLKTLRAMSLAVIHELSQPLSTLSIETRYLARLSQSPSSDRSEINEVAQLVAQKTESLANMLRRLRSFGAAPGEQSCRIDVERLVRDVIAIIAPEARSAGVRIEMRIKKHLAVEGQELELQQALTNLLRNAIAASPAETVKLVAQDGRENTIRVDVINTPSRSSPYRKGMGIGKLIVEAIAEIHGGSLAEQATAGGERHMILTLPAAARAGAA